MEEGEEDEEEEGEEEGEEEVEVSKPRKRIGRPPKAWSSILLPKEVTSTLGTHMPRPGKSQKGNFTAKSSNFVQGESKVTASDMLGQAVLGVVDGCFDAGYLVSLRMGDSDHIYRGVVFGPGLSIPVSKETDIAKNVKQKRRKQKQLGETATSRGEPSTSPPTLAAPPREEAPTSNIAFMQTPKHYEALPPPQHTSHFNSAQRALDNPHIRPIPPPPHPHQFTYNGARHADIFRSPAPHPDMNVIPFIHPGSFPPRPSMLRPPPAQGYSPRRNFGLVMPSPSTPYGYNFAGVQGRPSTPLPQYWATASDPQYRGP